MQRDTLALLDVFLCHQTQCYKARVDFAGNFCVDFGVLPVDEEAQLIPALVVADAIAMRLTRCGLYWQLVKVAKVFRLDGVFRVNWRRDAGKRQTNKLPFRVSSKASLS